jgi:membrane dipeptidase
MNEIGMLVDISHISDRGFWDAVNVSNSPLIGTHNCCRALTDHPRNLTDDQIRVIADGGGVIGATLVRDFVDRENPSLDRFLDHVEHFAEVGGIDCVGIGSDFDGGGEVLTDAGEFQRIAEGLSDRGWSDDDLAKAMGLNHLRLFEQVCG